MKARDTKGLNSVRRRHVGDIVNVEFAEFSYRSEVTDQRMIGVTPISHEVSCLERSWASDQAEQSLNPDSTSLAKWVNNPYLTSFLVLLT